MSDANGVALSPSEQLAIKIADALIEKELVTDADASRMQQQMAAGKLKSEDWRILIEKAIDKGVSNG